MVTYKAPLDDIRFWLYELFDYEGRVAALSPSPHIIQALPSPFPLGGTVADD